MISCYFLLIFLFVIFVKTFYIITIIYLHALGDSIFKLILTNISNVICFKAFWMRLDIWNLFIHRNRGSYWDSSCIMNTAFLMSWNFWLRHFYVIVIKISKGILVFKQKCFSCVLFSVLFVYSNKSSIGAVYFSNRAVIFILKFRPISP